jgi:hypothetical protein
LLAGLIAIAAFGCLLWSGSKGGWLLMLGLALLAFLRLPFGKTPKRVLVSVILLLGLAGFLWKYIGFFERGATSVAARFDYWQVALKIANANPITGTGPGTFSIPYERLKRPEAEMARLTHNDYLEQASDSGWGGFFAYTLFITAALYITGKSFLASTPQPRADLQSRSKPPATHAPRPQKQRKGKTDQIRSTPKTEISNFLEEENSWQEFCLWLGVLGWALQGLFDFGLYIPALAWPAFTFLGLGLGRAQIKSTKSRLEHNFPDRHANSVPQRA